MATRIPPTLYSGGVVEFDSRPEVAMYANLLSRKQAREDALDEYYRKLPATVNSQGVRDQDRGTINQQMSDAMQYWLKNKESIRNPRADQGKAQLELENRYRNIRQIVDESKQRGKTALELGKMKFDPTKSYIFDDDGIVDALHKHDLPVGVDGSSAIDLATITVPPKPFGSKEESDAFKGAVGALKPSKQFDETATRRDKTSGQVFVPYAESFTEDQVKRIAKNYADTASKPMLNHYWKQLHDQTKYNEYNDAYKSVYGKDSYIYTPQQATEAAAILKARTPIGQGEEMRTDSDLAFQRQKMMEDIRQANRKELFGMRQAAKNAGDKENEVWIDSYIDKLLEEANAPGNEKLEYVDNKNSKRTVESIVPMDAVLSKALEKQKTQPSELSITSDGLYRPIYYKYKDGERVKGNDGRYLVDTELSIPITRDQLKLSLGGKTISVGQRTKEMMNSQNSSKPAYKIGNDSYTADELKSAGWTDKQIQEAIKSKKIIKH